MASLRGGLHQSFFSLEDRLNLDTIVGTQALHFLLTKLADC